MADIREAGTTATGSGDDARERVDATAGEAKAAASQIKDEVRSAAGDVREQAGSELATLQDEARREARNITSEARDQLGSHAEDATRQLASTIAGAGRELRSMADGSERPDSTITEFVRQLADRSEQFADRLETGGYRAAAQDIARIGRNRPALFLLAAGAAGFAVGRLLRNTDTSALTDAAKGETGSDDVAGATTAPAPAAYEAPEPYATYAPPVAEPVVGRV